VRVDGRAHLADAALERRHEPQQRAPVVGLREALAGEDPPLDQRRVRQQEAVGGDERDAPVRPQRRQQPHNQARRRALADRDAPAQRDEERDAARVAQERALGGRQRSRRLDPQLEQPRQRAVDVGDLVDRDRLAEAAEPGELVVGQWHRPAAELAPALAGDRRERRRRREPQQQRAWGRSSRASWRRRSKSRRDITGSPGCSRRQCST